MNSFKVMTIARHRLYSDGKGITTLVALFSCPLKCKYCLNKQIINLNKFKEISIESLKDLIMQDYCYFIATNGGVTFGGAEPLLQMNSIKTFRKILDKEINISIETSLNVNPKDFKMFLNGLEKVDFIIDIKDINNEIYKLYTGISNENVIENLKSLANSNLLENTIIRIPLIKNFNTDIDRTNSILFLKELGFKNFDKFEYIIR